MEKNIILAKMQPITKFDCNPLSAAPVTQKELIFKINEGNYTLATGKL